MNCTNEFNFSSNSLFEVSATEDEATGGLGRLSSRRLSMSAAQRSSTPKYDSTNRNKRRRSAIKAEHGSDESLFSKASEENLFFAYSKRLKASASSLNLYDIARKPLRKKTAKQGTSKSDIPKHDVSSFHVSEVSFGNGGDSFANTTLSSMKDASSSSRNQSFVAGELFFNKHSTKSNSTTRKSKKRRASDIGIKEIFTSNKPKNHLKPKNYDAVKLTKSKSVNVKAEKATLQDVLASKFGILQFRQFLQSEFSEENLDFWIECQIYAHCKGSKQKRTAAAIYEKYIAPRAPREVNLDCETKQKTANNVVNPSPSTFEEAQSKIYKLMESDSFQRFVVSPSANMEKILLKENKQNVVQTILTNGRRRLSL